MRAMGSFHARVSQLTDRDIQTLSGRFLRGDDSDEAIDFNQSLAGCLGWAAAKLPQIRFADSPVGPQVVLGSFAITVVFTCTVSEFNEQ